MDASTPLRVESLARKGGEHLSIGWFACEEAKISIWLNGQHFNDGPTYTTSASAIEEAQRQTEHFRLGPNSEVVILVTSSVFERVKLWDRANGGHWIWPQGAVGDLPAPILKAQRAVWTSRAGEIQGVRTPYRLRFEKRFAIIGDGGADSSLTQYFRPEVTPLSLDALACGLGFDALQVKEFAVERVAVDPRYAGTTFVRATGVLDVFLQTKAFNAYRLLRCGEDSCFNKNLSVRCIPLNPETGPRWALRKSQADSLTWTQI